MCDSLCWGYRGEKALRYFVETIESRCLIAIDIKQFSELNANDCIKKDEKVYTF